MFKKLCISAALLTAVSGTTFAKDGFYIGGGVGLSMLEVKESTTTPPEQHNLGGFGFIGGAFAGYNVCFNCCKFDLGVEGFIYGNTTETKIFHHETATKLTGSARYNYGVRVLPGFRLSQDIQAHLILGYVRGNFRLRDNGVFGTIHKDFNCDGYQVGGGLTIPLSCHLALRMDGVFNGFASKKHTGIATDGITVDTYKIQPYSFNSTVSVVYKF